jgi:hypothetical protein
MSKKIKEPMLLICLQISHEQVSFYVRARLPPRQTQIPTY